MDIDQLLANLRRQYGVSAKFAKSTRPLLEEAARSSSGMRNRLRAMVERSFAVEAAKQPRTRRVKLKADRPASLLSSMAEILHGWTTTAWDERPPSTPPS